MRRRSQEDINRLKKANDAENMRLREKDLASNMRDYERMKKGWESLSTELKIKQEELDAKNKEIEAKEQYIRRIVAKEQQTAAQSRSQGSLIKELRGKVISLEKELEKQKKANEDGPDPLEEPEEPEAEAKHTNCSKEDTPGGEGTELSSKLEAAEAAAAAAEAAAAAAEAAAAAAEAGRVAAEERAAALEEEVRNSEAMRMELENSNQALLDRIAELEGNLKLKATECESYNKAYKSLQKKTSFEEAEDREAEVARLRGELGAALAAQAEHARRRRSLEAKKEKVSADGRSLAAALGATLKEAEADRAARRASAARRRAALEGALRQAEHRHAELAAWAEGLLQEVAAGLDPAAEAVETAVFTTAEEGGQGEERGGEEKGDWRHRPASAQGGRDGTDSSCRGRDAAAAVILASRSVPSLAAETEEEAGAAACSVFRAGQQGAGQPTASSNGGMHEEEATTGAEAGAVADELLEVGAAVQKMVAAVRAKLEVLSVRVAKGEERGSGLPTGHFTDKETLVHQEQPLTDKCQDPEHQIQLDTLQAEVARLREQGAGQAERHYRQIADLEDQTNERIMQLEEEVLSLKREAAHANSQLLKTNKKLREIERKTGAYKEQEEVRRDEIKGMEKTIDKLREKLEEQDALLKDQVWNNEKLLSRIEELEEERAARTEELNDALKEGERARRAAALAGADGEAAQRRAASFLEKTRAMKRSLLQAKEADAGLRRRVRELERGLAEAQVEEVNTSTFS